MTKNKCKHQNVSKPYTLGRGYIMWVTCLDCGKRMRLNDYMKGDKD